MQRTLPILFISTALVACQSKQPQQYTETTSDLTAPMNTVGYSPSRHNVKLSSYVEQLVIALQQNSHKQVDGNIAVASFVNFDSSLRQTNVIGNQLAENFVTQLQRFGYDVYDSKLTRAFSVTEHGDFVFSREARTLRRNRNLCCVLAGTMIYAPDGIEVNVRLMDLSTQAVLSTANTTIPYFVVEHLGSPL